MKLSQAKVRRGLQLLNRHSIAGSLMQSCARVSRGKMLCSREASHLTQREAATSNGMSEGMALRASAGKTACERHQPSPVFLGMTQSPSASPVTCSRTFKWPVTSCPSWHGLVKNKKTPPLPSTLVIAFTFIKHKSTCVQHEHPVNSTLSPCPLVFSLSHVSARMNVHDAHNPTTTHI